MIRVREVLFPVHIPTGHHKQGGRGKTKLSTLWKLSTPQILKTIKNTENPPTVPSVWRLSFSESPVSLPIGIRNIHHGSTDPESNLQTRRELECPPLVRVDNVTMIAWNMQKVQVEILGVKCQCYDPGHYHFCTGVAQSKSNYRYRKRSVNARPRRRPVPLRLRGGSVQN